MSWEKYLNTLKLLGYALFENHPEVRSIVYDLLVVIKRFPSFLLLYRKNYLKNSFLFPSMSIGYPLFYSCFNLRPILLVPLGFGDRGSLLPLTRPPPLCRKGGRDLPLFRLTDLPVRLPVWTQDRGRGRNHNTYVHT